MKTTPFMKIGKRIALDDRGGILDRWQYGRLLQEAKAGRKQLPHGLIAALVKAEQRSGRTVSEREIQYRLKCADAYDTEAKVRTACADFGSWSALRDAGFPPVETVDSDSDDLLDSGLADAPDSWEQTELDIPGLKPVISVRGRKVPIAKGEGGATIADVAAYLDMCEQMHENFGKTVEQIRESLRLMREHGDDETNALEAWEAALDDVAEDES